MIIFGTRSTNTGQEQVNRNCQHCQAEDSIWVFTFRRYFHIFWIPVLPLWQSAVSECTHCKQVLRENEFDTVLKSACDTAKQNAKTPLWMFSGFIIVAILFFLALLLIVFAR